MQLWIRNQSKELLVKADCLVIKEDKIGWCVGTNKYILGKYLTQERCKSVIDEIYSLLENNGRTSDKLSALASAIKNEFICYQMPKE